jgi:hypothetical protein
MSNDEIEKNKTSKSIKSQINNNQKEAKIDKITN